MQHARHIASWMAIATLLAALPAYAQEDTDNMEIAKEYMELGQALYAAGKYDEAAAAFLKAYEAQSFPAFLFNAGVAFEKHGQYSQAVYYFKRYLSEEPEAADKEAIEARIASLEALPSTAGGPDEPPTYEVTKLCGGQGQPPCDCGGEGQPACATPTTPEAPPAAMAMKSIVKVQTKPDGAKVIVKDQEGNVLYTGMSPLNQTLEPGKYELRVEHPEYKAAVTPISVSEGRVYVVVVELSQGTFLGYLKVVSNVPGSKVYIDDRDAGSVGVTPWAAPLPTGDHEVWIAQPGYQEIGKQVSIGVGDSLELDVELARVDHGEVQVVANVDFAILSVDGKPVTGELGKGLVLQYPSGIHEVLVQAKGLKPYLAKVDIQKGMRTKILVRLNPKPSRKPAWVSFGLATAFLVAGIVFAVQSDNLYDEFMQDRRAGYMDNNDPRFHQTLGWAIGADFSFLMAGVMTVVGIVYMIRDPLPDTEGMIKDPEEFASLPEYSK